MIDMVCVKNLNKLTVFYESQVLKVGIFAFFLASPKR